MKRRVRSAIDRLVGGAIDRRLEERSDAIRLGIGSLETRVASLLPSPASVHDVEFKVFSQSGEDGVIQFLVRRLSPPDVFVEIGVADYTESNTRFLVMNDNWRGLIVNGGGAHQEMVRRTGLAWRNSIDAVSAFVDADNVDALIKAAGIEGDIGLLSIDVDGVDYWLWDAVTAVAPWIVVVEFNSVFGPSAAVTVPYDPRFSAPTAHPSWQYFGASLAALHRLASARGYRLVGVGSNGVNAFFVRGDVAGDLWDLTPAQAYVRSRIRTVRDPSGGLAYTGDDHAAVLRAMRDLPLVDLDAGAERTIGEVFGV